MEPKQGSRPSSAVEHGRVAPRRGSAVAVVILVVLAVVIAWMVLSRNKGENTSCGEFVNMSGTQRAAVIDEWLDDASATVRQHQLADTLDSCSSGRSDPASKIGDIFY